MDPSSLNLNSLISFIFGAQLALFTLRINREIAVGDSGRRTWFPIPDVINIVSMLSVIAFCVVLPLAHQHFDKTSAVVFSMASVLLAFHPLCMLGHYRLFTRQGRSIYLKDDHDDYPYYTGLEVFFIILAIACAATAGRYVYMMWSS
jgi:hypothetical protein